MHDLLVKAAIIIFLIIPLVIMVAAFVIAAMVMQYKDNLAQAEVKPHESCC